MPRHLMCPTADHLTATTWHDHLFHPPNFAALLKSPLRAYVMMATRTTTESEFFNSNQEAASLLSETEDNKILYTIIRPVTHQNYCYLQSTGRLGVWQLHTASHTLTPPRNHAMLIIAYLHLGNLSRSNQERRHVAFQSHYQILPLALSTNRLSEPAHRLHQLTPQSLRQQLPT